MLWISFDGIMYFWVWKTKSCWKIGNLFYATLSQVGACGFSAPADARCFESVWIRSIVERAEAIRKLARNNLETAQQRKPMSHFQLNFLCVWVWPQLTSSASVGFEASRHVFHHWSTRYASQCLCQCCTAFFGYRRSETQHFLDHCWLGSLKVCTLTGFHSAVVQELTPADCESLNRNWDSCGAPIHSQRLLTGQRCKAKWTAGADGGSPAIFEPVCRQEDPPSAPTVPGTWTRFGILFLDADGPCGFFHPLGFSSNCWHIRLAVVIVADMDEVTMQCCSRVHVVQVHHPSSKPYILVCLFWPHVMVVKVEENATEGFRALSHWSTVRCIRSRRPRMFKFHWMSCVSFLIASIHTQCIRMSRCNVFFQKCFCDIKRLCVFTVHSSWLSWLANRLECIACTRNPRFSHECSWLNLGFRVRVFGTHQSVRCLRSRRPCM